MRVLLTGGTGFVGSAVLEQLISAGHTVTAAVRSETAADAVRGTGATPVVGRITDREWFAAQLRQVDAAIHTAVPGDESPAEFDDAVIDAALVAFAGTEKPFVYTTGIWIYGSGEDLTEATAVDAPAITAWREAAGAKLLGGGIDARVVSPGIVYGYGKGIPNVIIGAPRTQDGALVLVGSGDQHWTTIHTDDLATLYVAVLERGSAGEVYFGVSGVSPTVWEIGEAVVGPGGSVVGDDETATRERLGADFADALLLSQQATGSKARSLGWAPTRPTLVEELSS
ncbi:MAG TPA: NAD-dependent epimerase/dehydratase family protein [Galbitalea sp.]|jgi:nucleoside-diphosphate-sugar epimerase